jgi:hypothetical protein
MAALAGTATAAFLVEGDPGHIDDIANAPFDHGALPERAYGVALDLVAVVQLLKLEELDGGRRDVHPDQSLAGLE